MQVQPLTAAAFSPFGDVIEANGSVEQFAINQGYTQRYHNLASIDVSAHQGQPGISIFRSTPLPLPLSLDLLERHPLASQAFMPLGNEPYLVVVAPPGELDETAISVFLAQPSQGVNYHAGTWHHFCLALNTISDFLVVDRIGDGHNCDEQALQTPLTITADDLHL